MSKNSQELKRKKKKILAHKQEVWGAIREHGPNHTALQEFQFLVFFLRKQSERLRILNILCTCL